MMHFMTEIILHQKPPCQVILPHVSPRPAALIQIHRHYSHAITLCHARSSHLPWLIFQDVYVTFLHRYHEKAQSSVSSSHVKAPSGERQIHCNRNTPSRLKPSGCCPWSIYMFFKWLIYLILLCLHKVCSQPSTIDDKPVHWPAPNSTETGNINSNMQFRVSIIRLLNSTKRRRDQQHIP